MDKSGLGHFGPPTAAVEVKLVEMEDEDGVSVGRVGSVHVKGPVVAAEEWIGVGVKGRWRPDGCLEIHQ